LSALRFLVDENLSVALPEAAHTRGYEATHVNHYGLRQAKDWDILQIIEAEDWVLVTSNVFEFRGRFRRMELHPGVIFIVPVVPRAQQIELFSAALDVLADFPEMVNIAIEVAYAKDGIGVDRYPLP
jgi:predicted nuclease of predicted toxin-antitoxin system